MDIKRQQIADTYESLYKDADEGSSREELYIALTNLAKLRIVRSVLRDVLVMDDDPFVPHDQWVVMNRQVDDWVREIEQALAPDEEGGE